MMRATAFAVAIALCVFGTLSALAGDLDQDGVPDEVEVVLGLDPTIRDNDLFGAGAKGAELFAMQQYRDFLSREGESGGIQYWTTQMSAGSLTRTDMIQAFVGSPEFEGAIAPVARLYFAYFLRIPDYGGLNYWIARSRQGTSLDSISDEFAKSPEFALRYGALSNYEFVALVYKNVLGRLPEPAGLSHWRGQLDSRSMTRGQVMNAFSESVEYRSLIANEVYVMMLYVGMLRRAPDEGGFSYWVDYVDRGNPGAALVNGFVESAEYRLRFGADSNGNGIRDEVDSFVAVSPVAHAGRLRTMEEYARLMEKLATGSPAATLVPELQALQTCAMELAGTGVLTTWEADSGEILARTGFSKRRTLNLLEAFNSLGAPGAVIVTPACPFDSTTGLAKSALAPKVLNSCKPNTTVYFVNGVWNDIWGATDGLGSLMQLGISETPRSSLLFSTMHNPTANFLIDVIEVFEQKEKGKSWSEFWRWLQNRPRSAAEGSDFASTVFQRVAVALGITLSNRVGYRSQVAPLVASYVDRIKADLAKGDNVLLVAHSQGNLFANEVYAAVKSANASRNRSIKLVGIGSPAEIQPDDAGAYTTLGPLPGLSGLASGDDLVIRPLRSLYTVVPTNHVLSIAEVAGGLRDPSFHTIAGSYLGHTSSRNRIRDQINYAISELEVEGGCTKTTLAATGFAANKPGTFAVRIDPNTTAKTVGSPPGTFEVVEGANRLCGGVIDSSGLGTCNYTYTSNGRRLTRASYSGGGVASPAWQASLSGEVEVNVSSGVVTSLVLSATPLAPREGETVTISAEIHPASSGPATGTVTFSSDGASLCTAVVVSTGTALCATGALRQGAHTITAAFKGAEPFLDSEAVLMLTVLPGVVQSTTYGIVNLVSATGYVRKGATATYSVRVNSASGLKPTGRAEVYATDYYAERGPDIPFCTTTILNGEGSCSVTHGELGTFYLSVKYVSDSAQFADSISRGSNTVLIHDGFSATFEPIVFLQQKVCTLAVGVSATGEQISYTLCQAYGYFSLKGSDYACNIRQDCRFYNIVVAQSDSCRVTHYPWVGDAISGNPLGQLPKLLFVVSPSLPPIRNDIGGFNTITWIESGNPRSGTYQAINRSADINCTFTVEHLYSRERKTYTFQARYEGGL